MNEFESQGTTLEDRSDKELKDLAKQVAVAARNKITASTTFWGSVITLEDIEGKIPALVNEVLKMRVGADDTSIPMQAFK